MSRTFPMRARLTGIGILAAAGLLIATVVHRQARSSDPSVDAAGWASPRVGSQGLLLADASDSFGASRKMLGSSSYTATGSTSDNSGQADGSSQLPNSTPGGSNNGRSNSPAMM